MANKKEDTTKEEVNVEIVEQNKNNKITLKVVVAIIIVLFIIICGRFAYDKLKDKNRISGVRNILKTKYVSVDCIGINCNGFVAIDDNKSTKYKVLVYNSKGEKVTSYKIKYNSKTKENVISVADDFYISSKVDSNNPLKVKKYYLKNKNNKKVYESSNKLSIINDYLISMKEDQQYTILNKKGKILYTNISNINTYEYGKYVELKIDNSYYVVNKKGEKLLNNYKISKIIKDEKGKELFTIVKNTKDDVYNYYDVFKEKIVGDSFNNYAQKKDSLEIVITKKENEENIKYLLKENGKQEKIDEDINKFKDELKEKIDSKKYKIYSNSIYKYDQKNVFVDNLSKKSFGVLNLKNNKYKKIFKYKSNLKTYNSMVTTLESKKENSTYFMINCSKSYCDKNQTIIYDLSKKEEIYKVNSNISNYIQYGDGYKVVKFISDSKFGSKYVVFDKKNKEMFVNENNTIIIDKDLEFGNESMHSLSLYSVKRNKLVNKNEVSLIKSLDYIAYKYEDKDDNIIILDSKGKEKVKVNKNSYIKLSDDNYVYVDKDILNIYNLEKDKTYKYKLKKNEKLRTTSGKLISPYKKAIFINNSSDNYIKIIDFKGKIIKKIKNAEISSVNINNKENKAYIITSKSSKKGNSYGLYVAQ